MTQQHPGERRRYVRLEQRHMLRHEKYVFGMTAGGEMIEEGMIKNYSLGGALFEAKVKYNAGDTLKLAISFRGWERYKNEFYKDDKTSRREPVIVLARVVRAQATAEEGVHDIAVEFVGLDEGGRWTLLKHIKAQLEKKTSLNQRDPMDEYYAADNSDPFGPFGTEGTEGTEGAEGAEELMPLVCFRLGGEQYALDMARVHEVLRLVPVTRVPQMPDFVLGIINARGSIIPVFDLRRKFALGGPPFGRASFASRRSRGPSGGNTIDGKAKLIVVDTREAPVSFVADELLDNVKVERSSIAPAPEGKLRIPGECVAGISRLDERTVIILDWDKMYELVQAEIRNFAS